MPDQPMTSTWCRMHTEVMCKRCDDHPVATKCTCPNPVHRNHHGSETR